MYIVTTTSGSGTGSNTQIAAVTGSYGSGSDFTNQPGAGTTPLGSGSTTQAAVVTTNSAVNNFQGAVVDRIYGPPINNKNLAVIVVSCMYFVPLLSHRH